jgi:diguanylate cyclase (GGDEF)-like protein
MTLSMAPSPQPAAATAAEPSSLPAELTLAIAAKREGNHRAGAKHAEQAAGLAATAGDGPQQAHALRLLALHQWRLGAADAAVHSASQALTLHERLDDRTGEIDALCVLAMAYNDLGFHHEALRNITRAVQQARELGDAKWISWTLSRAGVVYELMSDAEQASRFTRQALEIARGVPGAEEEAFAALNNLASAASASAEQHTRSGNESAAQEALRQARAYAEEAVELAGRSGNTHRQTIALANLASIVGLLGEDDLSIELLARVQSMATEHDYKPLMLSAHIDLAELHRRRGRHALAIKRLDQVLAQVTASEDPETALMVHRALYESHRALGSYRQALAHHEAYARLDRNTLLQRADAQARLLLSKLEVNEARVAADRARLDAELLRSRTHQLEAEHRALQQRSEELGRAAEEDALTGLRNRRSVDALLPLLMERAVGDDTPLVAVLADLDHFKAVNDTFGHAAGDEALKAIAQLLHANTRGTDVLARMGGEEFLLVLVGTPLHAAQETCERLRGAVQQHDWDSIAPGLRLTVSLGLAELGPYRAAHEWLKRCDAALYAAKREGRNRVVTL